MEITPKKTGKVFIPEQNQRKRAVSLCVFILLFLAAVLAAGFLLGEKGSVPNFAGKNLPPSAAHPFGTDWLGRDMFARTLRGLSTSIALGMGASVCSAVLAVLVGGAAAAGPKSLDKLLGWITDLFLSIPHLVLLILISFACGRGMRGLVLGITFTHWPSLARVVRAEVLQQKAQPYLAISRKMGKSSFWMFGRHILPHLVPQFLVGLVLLFPHAILHESALSFLGYGLPPEQPAVGIILQESMGYLTSGMWWTAVLPGLSLIVVVVLFDRLGDMLERLLSPAESQL